MVNQPYQHFEVKTDSDRVTTVTLDVAERPLNVLSYAVMHELDQIVHDLENTGDVDLVVFRSGKESGFLAGADVNAISDIQSAGEAARLIEEGQLLFQRIAWLPMPTVAVIHGPCLGGGLELALACDHRVARDNSSTQIGLPEIKLGLIPAWGGTQRLPKVVGLSAALKMILTGKHVDAAEAERIGLVDRAIRPEDWEHELPALISGYRLGSPMPPRRGKWWQRWAEDSRLGRWFILRTARRSVASRAMQYPALRSAIEAIRLGYEAGPAGFSCERSEFVKLLGTPTCRNLLDLFFARERARSLKTWTPGAGRAAHDIPTRRIGVVGAGAMGAGIGQLAGYRGFEVVLREIDQEAAQAGRDRIHKIVDSLARRKGWDDSQRAELMQRIEVTCDPAALAECDIVVEAVLERPEVKAGVFGMLDLTVKQNALLVSNTSSLSVTEMAAATSRPGQVAGLHFFNPVHRMDLVEVVRTEHTGDDTIARLVSFVRALGKTPIVTSDSSGFLVNRVLFPYLGEAVRMVGESYGVATIDRQVRRFGMPMGPLELLDQVGLDVAHHVASSLDKILPGVAPVVEQLSILVQAGHLGKKSGRGFYHYRKGKRGDVAELPHAAVDRQPSDDNRAFCGDGLTLVQRRLIYPMLTEAIRCLQERVVRQAWAIDLAMVLGTGFAPHLGGPLHLVNTIGLRGVIENLDQLRLRFGQRFESPQLLIEMADRGETFFGDRRSEDSNPITSS
ncbi:MAG: 3-hydroxyacyl-CoA dehydrogenase NAD-binding domain-containing protein [Pirellulales bacterium]|nr:3-hydroxyacyl-CoA dehydrogenase NAD-binding domain-containing protein [Pirellulales bacterium]